MYQLFKNPPIDRNKRFDSANFSYVQKLINYEIDRVKDYYLKSSTIVENTHLLNQLLLHLNVSLNRDLESFTSACSFETERLAKSFRLFHPVCSNPEPRQGLFYNNNVTEFIILDDSDFNYQLAYEQWEKVVPIKVHYHPFTDMEFRLADGKYSNDINERGFAVISINLPLLAVQWKAWVEKVQRTQDVAPTTTKFLFRYPIVNMIVRHAEIALINRTLNSYANKPVASWNKPHPFASVDLDDKIDNLIASRKNYISSSNFKFDELFSVFYCVRKQDWFEVLKPVELAPTRNFKWVLDLSVIPYLNHWLDIRRDKKLYSNVSEINRLKRDTANLENDAIYFKTLTADMSSLLKEFKIKLESA